MKKGKGKLAKKRLKFEERKPKAEKWLLEYNSDRGNLIKAYRKKFAVDRLKAIEELQKLGVKLSTEEIEKERMAVQAYKECQAAKKAKRRTQKTKTENTLSTVQDDNFYFIAGYTSGGAPYGIIWEEMGMNPYEEVE